MIIFAYLSIEILVQDNYNIELKLHDTKYFLSYSTIFLIFFNKSSPRNIFLVKMAADYKCCPLIFHND